MAARELEDEELAACAEDEVLTVDDAAWVEEACADEVI